MQSVYLEAELYPTLVPKLGPLDGDPPGSSG